MMAGTLLLTVIEDPIVHVSLALFGLAVFITAVFLLTFTTRRRRPGAGGPGAASTVEAYLKFFYSCFIKPHSGDGTRNQQDALESFYKSQADVYDATRERLLQGREDLLGLLIAQVSHRISTGRISSKLVWVDIGGGTGYNIEKMSAYVNVPDFFHAIYLVDLSPSLCSVARKRFARLGWKNVHVVCQDARRFRLSSRGQAADSADLLDLSSFGKDEDGRAEVITMSYALSMIPEYYSVVDSLATLLAPDGVVGVADFYVQSEVDYQSRNYIGGCLDRHCSWPSRVFWRSWFEVDRVGLEAARRDYLEYRFGTVLSINARNTSFGVRIPYYIWIGRAKETSASATDLAEVDAAATESPFLQALDSRTRDVAFENAVLPIHSKAYECAIVNLTSSLPLPASWYQNNHWRVYFDAAQAKHRRFNDEYIYSFTWEDSRVDARLLKIKPDDVILALTSAGDNILSYALEGPKRIHAVDLNPAQNHLLELKLAAFRALTYDDVWKLFGEGRHENFRELLMTRLSPHLSSLAFQYWLQNGPKTFGSTGLYYTGGARHALTLIQWLFRLSGSSARVRRLCNAQTLNEQREIWYSGLRSVLLNRFLSWSIIGNEGWLWKALGVPAAQRRMIVEDYIKRQGPASRISALHSGRAIWQYGVDTLDPVIHHTLIGDDNHYYLLCAQGRYSTRCHPTYLTPKAYARLSSPRAFDGIRVHTDELSEVIARMAPHTLTIAVLMDSMDWFSPTGPEAAQQIKAIYKALRPGGRVLLRSAGMDPWYIKVFEEHGFAAKNASVRAPGLCVDRVNMYASTWICHKISSVNEVGPHASTGASLKELQI